MMVRESTGKIFNTSHLRVFALLTAGWVVFLSLIPDFLMRILHVNIPLLSSITWGGGIILISGFTGYLCIRILKAREIAFLVIAGISVLLVSQSFRIFRTLGFLDAKFLADWTHVIRGIDNLFNGLGLVLIALAFIYVLIEMVEWHKRLLAEHARLSEEIMCREKLEIILHERDALLDGINTSALDGIIVMDNAGLVTFWNPSAERILGYQTDEVIGKSLHTLLVPPHRKPEYHGGITEWQRTGRGPVVGKTTELKALAKNGQEVDIELSVSSMQISGEWHAVGILRDITRRKQSEIEYKMILQTAMDGFWIVDGEGKFLDVNDAYCQIIGYTREELLQMSIYDVETAETLEEIRKHIELIHEKGADRFETCQKRKDGTTIDIEVSVSGHKPGDDNRQYVFLRDITAVKRSEEERRDLEAQIQYAQKLESLGVLAGGIAHDFNNILQIVLGNVNLIQKLIPEHSPSRPFVDNIRRSVDRASSLTRQMLAYSGKRSVALQTLDIGDVVREFIPLIQSSVSKKITLQVNLIDDLPQIEADATQIQQVVMNLLLNASESLNEEHGGVVAVSTMVLHCTKDYLSRSRALFDAPEGDYVCLEVKDNGCGMSDEVKEKLFDPFFTTKFTGRGLGMSAVLGIMKAHKGALILDSFPGKGTDIRVLFPALPCGQTVFPEEAGGRPEIPRIRHTVLFVDDEADVLEIGTIMLRQLGYTVITANNGLDAVEIFNTCCGDVDCVLLDLSMPRMDGVQTLQELRRIQPDIPVILASGYAEEDIEARFDGQNVNAFLQKPYDERILSGKLDQILNLQRMPSG